MRTTLFSLAFAGIAMLSFTSCRTTVSLDYHPNTSRNLAGPEVFVVGEFRDLRGMKPKAIGRVDIRQVSAIAAVPLERVELNVPVSEAVAHAFGHGLKARTMLATSSRPELKIAGEIRDLHCDFIESPYARAVLLVTVSDARSGRVLHSKEYKAERQSVFFVEGTADPLPILRDLTSRALEDTVDLALNDPEMREKLP